MRARLARLFSTDAASAPLSVASTGRTHVGRVRTINEDRLLDRPDRRLWAIADGMGGHSAGDVAASTAIAALAALAEAPAPITGAGIEDAVQSANRTIALASGGGQSGTTIVVTSLEDDEATVTWAGDSRCYLMRDGSVRQLTRDHSVVQDLVEAGLVAAADAARHPRAHVITRALGVAPSVALDTVTVEVRAGDRLLLCSDGLSRSLADQDFALRQTIEAQADRLLTNALQRDGSDNISLLLIDIGR